MRPGTLRVLGIKEQNVLDPLFEFLGRRIFGPERLRLLRAELASSVADTWRDHKADLERLRHELSDVDRALYRQTLRLEEHDDPNHPVVSLAKRRIEELAGRRTAIEDQIAAAEA